MPKKPKSPRLASTPFRVVIRDAALVEALDRAAAKKDRVRTHQAVHYIRRGLIADGFLADAIVPPEEGS